MDQICFSYCFCLRGWTQLHEQHETEEIITILVEYNHWLLCFTTFFDYATFVDAVMNTTVVSFTKASVVELSEWRTDVKRQNWLRVHSFIYKGQTDMSN